MVRTVALRFCLFAIPVLAWPALYAQAPHADWQTIETEHFRVHYPAMYEAWSTHAASRLESVRAAVVTEVGFAPAEKTDVLVMNPLAEPNGATYPFLDTPRIVLYVEPPGPQSQIGDYSNWIDLLTVHEVTHLVHLLRPSRNPTEHLLERFLPLNPIVLGAPRWILEGYATRVEGRLTGSGRPSSAIRAAILRKWAANGRLPSYGELDSRRRFLGRSMAYLVGSAFLEWLEARSGRDALQHLWRRMTARQRRDFDEAFEGVFGEKPARLYGFFTAELTSHALGSGGAAEGELWQETRENSGEPVVSPDGNEVAVVLRARGKPSRLVVWSTAAPTQEQKKYEQRIARMLNRDPEDVVPVQVKPLRRKPRYTLTPPDGGEVESPRWMPDGRSILFVHRQPDRDGFLHHDLFRWILATRALQRLTKLADVSDADPFPDGASAVAVRSRDGFSQLVIVNLLTGEVAPLTEPSLDRVYDHPRVSRDGKRIAFTAHRSGAWQLVIRDVAGGRETPIPLGDGANVASPEWSRTSDEIYAVVLARGFIDIHRFEMEGAHEARTATIGAAFDPAPSPDGRLFFMSLEPDGFVVRVLSETPPPTAARSIDHPLVPAISPRPAKQAGFAEQPVSSKRYGIGRPEIAWIASGNSGSSGHSSELGARVGDVVGKLDLLVLVSSGTFDGASLGAAWRGLPIVLSTQVFGVDEGEVRHRGIEFRASWDGRYPLHRFVIEAGALCRCGGGRRDERGYTDLAFADAAVRSRQVRYAVRFDEELRLAGEAGRDAQHLRAVGAASATASGWRLTARLQRDSAHDSMITVGGIAPSVLPMSALANRILDPALPRQIRSGDRYTGFRGEISRGPFTVFWQEHRLSGRMRVTGIELAAASDPIPILKAPALDLTLGVGRTLDAPLRNRTKSWIGIRWHP